MPEELEVDDLEDDEDSERFTAADRVLMAEHAIDDDDYDALYHRVLEDTQAYGTLAMSAIQKLVIADVESGMWD
jgi:hypothetical protein